jgi:putative transposase
MPLGLHRYFHTGDLHFITFSCYRRQPLLVAASARECFENELERVRRWYSFGVIGYVVMPEHVHLLISEPDRKNVAVVIQILKQVVSRRMGAGRFWQVRYYDFLVRTPHKRVEKLRYMHRNPVKRGLVAKAEDWQWSSFIHYSTGVAGPVEIESPWTGARRERMGVRFTARRTDQ